VSSIKPWTAQIGAVRVLFGSGRVVELGPLAQEVLRADGALDRGLEGGEVLLVTDPGVREAGHAEVARQAVEKGGFRVHVFDGVAENPTTDDVRAGLDFALEAQKETGEEIRLIVAVGGGSAMDCAKGVNFLLTNGGCMEDYRGKDRAEKPMLPSLGVPTTAGTGSEAQSFALISRASDHVKMACGDAKARFHAAVLDPQLIATVPPGVAALTGLDAVSHAVESFVSRTANPVSRMYAREAWKRLERHLPGFLDTRRDGRPGAEEAAELLWGAHLAGAAIEQSMLGAAHALANPLTARHGVPHGAAVLLMLPWVVRFNGEADPAVEEETEAAGGGATVNEHYRELCEVAGVPGTAGEPSEDLARRLEELRTAGGLPERLRDAGVSRKDLEDLARDAAEQWTARFNPRPVERTDLLRIYELAY
jgi:alcohol dehydrogenase